MSPGHTHYETDLPEETTYPGVEVGQNEKTKVMMAPVAREMYVLETA